MLVYLFLQTHLLLHSLVGDRSGYLWIYDGEHVIIGPTEMRSHVHAQIRTTSLASVQFPATTYFESGVINYGGLQGIDQLFIRGEATLDQQGLVISF